MKTGDILLIPFPFSELTGTKVRPALVVALTKDKYKDIIVTAISSVIPSHPNENEIIINPICDKQIEKQIGNQSRIE